jgi:hypothetical protein
MTEVADNELWKKAYRQQFGTDPDEDMAEHSDEVEAWRTNWQAGYDAGEEWATSMIQESPAA